MAHPMLDVRLGPFRLVTPSSNHPAGKRGSSTRCRTRYEVLVLMVVGSKQLSGIVDPWKPPNSWVSSIVDGWSVVASILILVSLLCWPVTSIVVMPVSPGRRAGLGGGCWSTVRAPCRVAGC